MITRLCKTAHVPIVTSVDNEFQAKKTHIPNRIDESRPTLVLGKGMSGGSDPIIFEVVQTPGTVTNSMENMQLSVPEFIHATFSVGVVHVTKRE